MRGALLIDLVGTLIDEQTDYASLDAAMDAARRHFGVPATAEELSGDFSLALMEILQGEPNDDDANDDADEPSGNDFLPFEQAAKEIFAAVMQVRGVNVDAADVDWWWSTFVAIQRRLIRLHPDALEALEWARQDGWRIIIITDADDYLLHDVLTNTPLPPLWDAAITATQAGAPKPSPRIFAAALKAAGQPAYRCVMIGDNYERDIQGAQAAGIHRAILIDRHHARTIHEVPVITSLTALPAALARLEPSMN